MTDSIIKELIPYFNALKPVRDILESTLDKWSVPSIVVFGDESAGKSTLLERLAMIPIFPKGANLCTRLPIVIQLRNSKEKALPELFVVDRQGGRDGPGPLDQNELGENLVREYMEKTVKIENAGKGISKNAHLELTLTGPEYPHLDLVDLPGLVLNVTGRGHAVCMYVCMSAFFHRCRRVDV